MPEHDLLGHGDRVFVMEDEQRIGLHVDALDAILKHLQTVVKVDHAELGNQLVICFSQLD